LKYPTSNDLVACLSATGETAPFPLTKKRQKQHFWILPERLKYQAIEENFKDFTEKCFKDFFCYFVT
jgi:hypothetical protein